MLYERPGKSRAFPRTVCRERVKDRFKNGSIFRALKVALNNPFRVESLANKTCSRVAVKPIL